MCALNNTGSPGYHIQSNLAKMQLRWPRKGIDTLKLHSSGINQWPARKIFFSLTLSLSLFLILYLYLSRSMLEVSTCHSPILNLRYFWHFSKALHANQTTYSASHAKHNLHPPHACQPHAKHVKSLRHDIRDMASGLFFLPTWLFLHVLNSNLRSSK